jgi:hypothetical protein
VLHRKCSSWRRLTYKYVTFISKFFPPQDKIRQAEVTVWTWTQNEIHWAQLSMLNRKIRAILVRYVDYMLECCCTVLFSGYCRLCFRLRAASLCWFPLSFTTCFGLHSHLQVCRIFYFHMLEGFCFAVFSAFFSRGHTLHVSICDFFLCFPSLFLLFPCVCVCLLACKEKKAAKQNPSSIRK